MDFFFQTLCNLLLQNCLSPNPQISGVSLRIFVALVVNFRDHLKQEIEIFISNIFLAILESSNSTFDHKVLVLEVFHKLCQNVRTLTEIFLNYDCDAQSIDLFDRIINALSRVAQGVFFLGLGLGPI